MRSTIISTTSDHIASGGTITGDLTISGDLSVEGGGSFTYDEMLTGNMQITSTGDTTLTIKGAGSRTDGNTPRGHLHFVRDSSDNGSNDDVAGIVQVSSTDAGGNDGLITEIQYLTSTATAGSVVSDIVWKTVQGTNIGTRTEAMRIQGGNVGIGVVPEATNSLATALQVGGNAYLISTTSQGASGEMDFGHNFYWNAAGNQVYISTDEATQYRQGGGTHRFKTVASGSADATISWTTNMIIDINSRISLSNNDASGGASTTIFGYQAGNAIASGGAYNTIMGHNAALILSTGEKNCVFGYTALDGASTEADDNVAIGYNAMGGAIGTEAVNDCVAVGSDALSGA